MAQLPKQAFVLPLLAMAAKRGGPDAVNGILAGMQQAQARQDQQARQGMLDKRQADIDQRTATYQDAQMANMEAQRRAEAARTQAQLLADIPRGLGELDSPEQAQAYLGMVSSRMGVPAEQLQSLLPAPSVYDRKRAEKYVGKLKSLYGEKWLENGSKFLHTLTKDGPQVPLAQVLEMAGMTPDPNAPAQTPPDEPKETPAQRVMRLRAELRKPGLSQEQIVELQAKIADAKAAANIGDDTSTNPLKAQMDELRLQTMITNAELARQRLAEAQAKANRGGISLSAAQQQDLSDMKLLSDQATQTLQMGAEQKWAGVGGLGQGSLSAFMLKNFGRGSAEGGKLRAAIGNIRGYIAKLRGGTSFTPNEQRLLDTYTPGINSDPKDIIAKLQQLQDFLVKKAEALVTTTTANPNDIVGAMRSNLSAPVAPVPSHGGGLPTVGSGDWDNPYRKPKAR